MFIDFFKGNLIVFQEPMEEDKSDDPCVEYVHSDVGRD